MTLFLTLKPLSLLHNFIYKELTFPEEMVNKEANWDTIYCKVDGDFCWPLVTGTSDNIVLTGYIGFTMVLYSEPVL